MGKKKRKTLPLALQLALQTPMVGEMSGIVSEKIEPKAPSKEMCFSEVVTNLKDASGEIKKESEPKKCFCRKCQVEIPKGFGPYCAGCRDFVRKRKDSMILANNSALYGTRSNINESRGRRDLPVL